MKHILKKGLISILILILSQNLILGQLDSVMNKCERFLSNEYISDGQQYLSLITDDQIAEFSVLFYGGNTYRIITYGGNEKNSLIFVVYDIYRNELFRSSEYDNTSYWDFQFESTIECFIEAKLKDSNNNSGFAVLLIGLKK